MQAQLSKTSKVMVKVAEQAASRSHMRRKGRKGRKRR
jgi:hypothetical protein